jgi:hypothetical protein
VAGRCFSNRYIFTLVDCPGISIQRVFTSHGGQINWDRLLPTAPKSFLSCLSPKRHAARRLASRIGLPRGHAASLMKLPSDYLRTCGAGSKNERCIPNMGRPVGLFEVAGESWHDEARGTQSQRLGQTPKAKEYVQRHVGV